MKFLLTFLFSWVTFLAVCQEEVQSTQRRTYKTRFANTDIKESPIGGRIGVMWLGSGLVGHGFHAESELGFRPSYFGANFYFQLGLGFSFSTLLRS